MAFHDDSSLTDLFKSVGSKLGWFLHEDLSKAIRQLSIQSGGFSHSGKTEHSSVHEGKKTTITRRSTKSEETIVCSDSSAKDTPEWETKCPASVSALRNTSSKLDLRDLSESSDDDFENFLTMIKTPLKPSRPPLKHRIDNLPSSSDRKGTYTQDSTKIHPQSSAISNATQSEKKKLHVGFLGSLSTNVDNDNEQDLKALRYAKCFPKNKEELTSRLFKLYNETVFETKLSSDLEVKWNKRLLKTAGYCAYKKSHTNMRTARIELSDKVCDTAERVRDTLAHEMCHAAVWLINGANDGHGPLWKYWARKFKLTHPDLPAIRRCHSYDIKTKYTYQCIKCSYQFGRHSKSLDTTKKVCGYCHGTFQLLVNNKDGSATPHKDIPSTPNRFSTFVKENYALVKKESKEFSHKDVMNMLSEKFALSKIS